MTCPMPYHSARSSSVTACACRVIFDTKMSPILLKGCIPLNHEVNYDVLIIVIQGIRQSSPARGNPKVPYERQGTQVPNWTGLLEKPKSWFLCVYLAKSPLSIRIPLFGVYFRLIAIQSHSLFFNTFSAPKSKHSIADTMIIRFDHVI